MCQAVLLLLLGSLCVPGLAFSPRHHKKCLPKQRVLLAAASDDEKEERDPLSFFDIDADAGTSFLEAIFNKDEDPSTTLLEPYSEGLPEKVENVVLSNDETNETETQQQNASTQVDSGEETIVEGGPASFLGKIMGDDETTLTKTSPSSKDDDSSQNNTKTAAAPSIPERIAEVVAGQYAGDSSSDGLASLAQDFQNLVFGNGEGGVMDSLLQSARRSASRGYEDDERSYDDLLRVVNQHRESIGATLKDTFSPVDFSKLTPTSLFYYLEYEDQRKNPSWKRMVHRFHPEVEIEKVEELNEQLYLAQQSYCDTVDEVREGLKSAQEPVELVFCDTESFPGRPAHFVAVKKNQPHFEDHLEVLMVVRGTKSITDIITDGLLAPEDYRGGKVHAGFLESGTYLVDTHIELLRKLRGIAKKEKIKLTLIGHSLGGGACSVAAIEFNDYDDIDAKAIGFGSPSLLSKELSESTEGYITTVIADSDIVPRLNDITVANTALDLMEHDWTPLARRDIDHAFQELQRFKPGLMSDSTVDDIMALVDAGLAKFAKPKLKDPTTERLEPVLFPPGMCIHFYRDGMDVSATYTPSSFFDEIEVSRTCIRDHLMVGGYSRIFLQVMREYENPHFVFENCLLE